MTAPREPADLHLLTGAYASGALTDAEHDAFVAHLSSCSNCRVEVAELVATAALLGVAAAEAPPAGFRERLMAEVAQTRQLPPVVTTLDEARREQASGTRISRIARRGVLSAAASAVVLAVGLGVWGLSLNDENSELRQQNDRIAAVQTAADARTVHSAVGGATAALTVSPSKGELVFMAAGLSNLGPDRTYQVWMLGPGATVTSMGTFDSDGRERLTRLFPAPADATTLAVTTEPAGGSTRPTTKPVMAMDLPRGA